MAEIIGGETIAARIQEGDAIRDEFEFVGKRGRGEKKCPNGYALM